MNVSAKGNFSNKIEDKAHKYLRPDNDKGAEI